MGSFLGGEADLVGNVGLPVSRSVGADLAEFLRSAAGVLSLYFMRPGLKFIGLVPHVSIFITINNSGLLIFVVDSNDSEWYATRRSEEQTLAILLEGLLHLLVLTLVLLAHFGQSLVLVQQEGVLLLQNLILLAVVFVHLHAQMLRTV